MSTSNNSREFWSLSVLLSDLERGIRKLRSELTPYLKDDPRIESFFNSKEKDLHDFKRYTSTYYLGCPMGTLVNSLRASGVDSRFYGGMTHRGAEYFNVSKEIQNIIDEIELQDYYDKLKEEKENLDYEEEYSENNPDYCIPDETEYKW